MTKETTEKGVDQLVSDSPFLAELERLRWFRTIPLAGDWFSAAKAMVGTQLRRLTSAEILHLESRGNRAISWNDVLVVPEFIPDWVMANFFAGPCILGRFDPAEPGEAPTDVASTKNRASEKTHFATGIYDSTLQFAVIDGGVAIHRCQLISGYRISKSAVVFGSTLLFEGESSCANGMIIPVGIETGGRVVVAHADCTLEEVRHQAEHAASRGTDLQSKASTLADRTRMRLGHVGEGSLIMSTTRIRNSFIGSYARVVGAQIVDCSTLAATKTEQTTVADGAIVRSSILQPGVDVTDGAIVDRSLLLEHSCAERQAKVTASVIGPNSAIGEGEVTASFVGPFVGFHHQALLIAAFWPEGKGNVGYGANVGSNHTSRLPDQEIRPGEGMFFGLGCNVKFPANFKAAPYSIVATGLSTLPQRLTMPFSLLTEPNRRYAAVPNGYCQIRPAWVLSDNLYMVWRSQMKFRERNRACRASIPWKVFRDEIVQFMVDAAETLDRVAEKKEIYLPENISGIGKAFLTEADRAKAVETYRFFVRFAALAKEAEKSPVTRSSAMQYCEAVAHIADAVHKSREKDDTRGRRIIDDYSATHPTAEEDPVVKDAKAWAAAEIARVTKPHSSATD